MTTDTQAIIRAIQENFRQIMEADPQGKREIIDGIFEFAAIERRVAEAMAEPELVQ
jgi:hypothetical protein